MTGDRDRSGLVLVPHTHWDREWYEPFQVFRMRLVDVLDEVVDRAEADPAFCFTIDGQMAAVDDYLEIRPERRPQVARLVARGQLAVGPWHILLDEFLCSGETIVRNLEMGWRGAEALGRAMPVGYLPDMFGHCAQMPQILARAGIRHACLWRGVPASVDRHRFRWAAPDGSSVRVEYLFDGYGSALDLFAVPSRLAEAVDAYVADTRSWYGGDPVLGMLGTDHFGPRADWLDLAAEAEIPVTTIDDYVLGRTGERDGDLPVVHGEMRSHARGNILPGVISIRVGLKAAMARAERLVGDAEALAAQWSEASFEPFFRLAWRRIIESTAHDSVTGCGVDETADQVAARLAEAAQVGRAVSGTVALELAGAVPPDAHLVVNTLPVERTVLAELDVPAAGAGSVLGVVLADGTPLPVQDLGPDAGFVVDETMDDGDLERVMRRIHGRELFGQQIDRFRIADSTLTFDVAQSPTTPDFDLAALRSELAAAVAERPGTWRVTTRAEPRNRLLAAVPVPASGHVAARAEHRPNGAAPTVDREVIVDDRRLDNGRVRVEVADDGTLSVHGADGTTLHGVGRLVSGGDRGDSYNYGPPADDALVDTPSTVRVDVVESGPLRGILRVTRAYDWPVSLSDDVDTRSSDTVRVPVTMSVQVRAGEPFVRLDVSFVNAAKDHRVRLHVPLPEPVAESAAGGQFAVTTRGLTSEGGWGEYPVPTFPADSFVSAGDATVLLDHVTEYELVDGGSELALTLLRAVGWMSVNAHPWRDEPAGSEFAVPGAQYLGVAVDTRLAVLPRRGGWSVADAPSWSQLFRHDVLVERGRGGRDIRLPQPRRGISVTGPGVVTSSVRRVDDAVEIRLLATTPEPTRATVSGPFARAGRTDLLGRPLDDLVVENGRLTLDLAPWEIATIRVS